MTLRGWLGYKPTINNNNILLGHSTGNPVSWTLVLGSKEFTYDQAGDIAQWLVSRNSNPKTMGSIPWWVEVGDSSSVPLSQLLCTDLFVPDPPLCVWHAPKFLHRLKIPYPSVIKSRPHSQWYHWKNENPAHRKKKQKKLGSAVLWLLAFVRESSPNSPCVALGQESYPIQSSPIGSCI